MENIENIDYKIGDTVWIELKFLTSRKLPETKNLILINTITHKDTRPFYIYWTKILGIVINITDIYESYEGIKQLITVYCKSYFFCRNKIQEPEFGSLKFYTPKDLLIGLKGKLKKEEVKIYSTDIKELNARFGKHCKKCEKIKKIIKNS